jgi:hypothetical protein
VIYIIYNKKQKIVIRSRAHTFIHTFIHTLHHTYYHTCTHTYTPPTTLPPHLYTNVREKLKEDLHLIAGLVPMNQAFFVAVVSAFLCYVLVYRCT